MGKSFYIAFNLTDEARAELLSRFKPSFPNVVAHHVTHQFGVPPDSVAPSVSKIRVIGFAKNDDIECAVVEVNGEAFREWDGKRYHITLSHTSNARPVHSNQLLASQEFEPCEHFELAVESNVNQDD